MYNTMAHIIVKVEGVVEKQGYESHHDPTGYINITGQRCLTCNKRASYGLPGTKKGIYCSGDALIGYINVTAKRCLKCNKQPTRACPEQYIPFLVPGKPYDARLLHSKHFLATTLTYSDGACLGQYSRFLVPSKPYVGCLLHFKHLLAVTLI